MVSSLPLFWLIAPISAITALIIAKYLHIKVIASPKGTPRMEEIAGYVKEGALAYLKSQNRVVAVVFVILFAALLVLSYLGVQSYFVPFAFISGGFWSGVCGMCGMKTATSCSVRTAAACRDSLNKGLQVSFYGGAVMGLVVVGFALLDLSIWFLALNYIFDHNLFNSTTNILIKMGGISFSPELAITDAFQKIKFVELTTVFLGYSMGASIQALFARVGGGIFTKAADVGADLVGKVEAGIPEDDPRNPATIADNVGDNVGDVAGMGADLYESYCGSILAAMALGASIVLKTAGPLDLNTIIAPMLVAGGGIFFSILGIFLVKTHEGASQQSLLHSLHFATNISSIGIIGFVAFLANQGFISWGIFGSVVIGLLSGIGIGLITEYFTSANFMPTKKVAKTSLMGSATIVLEGMSVGMMSTGWPVVIVVVGMLGSFGSAGGFSDVTQGIYGVAFAAIGMLSTLGITLATDAFGPIADNAGGNAEMSGLPPEVRERTDALDSLGNTTAATGKGFAIGSAALTALALIAAYMESIKQWLGKIAGTTSHTIGSVEFTNFSDRADAANNIYFIGDLDIVSIVELLKINVINPQFLAGVFLGSMAAFVFSSLTIFAVSKAAGDMVREVRRQFKEIVGIMDETGTPNYARCVAISTEGAQKAMILPSLLSIATPIIVGLVLGIPGVMGLLIGTLSTGFTLAIMLNNAGGCWDNAKKLVESGEYGGKGTDAHKASITGDTVGDPFKDTAGPSLNILIKLMTIISIVFVGVVIKYGFTI